MTLSAQSSRLIETRVFAVVMVFSVVSGFFAAFAPYFFIFLVRFGLSSVELSFASILQISLQYLVSPVLFFVVLYVTCGGPLLTRIASVLSSLVLGSLMGYPIGGLIASLVVGYQLGQFGALFYLVSSLPQHVIGQTLIGFAVLAFSDMNLRWKNALPVDAFPKTRPGGVTLLVVLYVVSALVSTLALPVLTVFSSFRLPQATLVVIALGVVFGLMNAGQLIVAAGLYYGKKWGWILAVISAASSLVISLINLGVMLGITVTMGTLMLVLISLALIAGFILDLAILVYLMRIDVRSFFGFVNSPGQMQDKPTGAESA